MTLNNEYHRHLEQGPDPEVPTTASTTRSQFLPLTEEYYAPIQGYNELLNYYKVM